MTFTGVIRYASESKGDRRRFVVMLRQTVARRVGDVVDITTGKYLTHKTVAAHRDDYFYVWLTPGRGQLLGSLCEQYNVRRVPVTITADHTPHGWSLTSVQKAKDAEQVDA